MSDPADLVNELPAAAPDDSLLKLLGNVDDKRVLVLGVGRGEALVALASRGARVIGVDPSVRVLDRARARCEEAEVRAELHRADLAELPFLRADTIDGVLSVMALAGVSDLDRVFRQAHRVLRSEAPLVLSLPHPVAALASGRSYFDHQPRTWSPSGVPGAAPTALEHPRTVSDVFTSVNRANFRMDLLNELPSGPGGSGPPSTLVIRARKEGV